MAEVIVGLIASGISISTLAAQMTSSIIKIKGFCDQLKTATEDTQDIVGQLEMIHSLLADIEDDQRQNPLSSLIWNSDSASRCLQYCRQAAEQLKELTETLSVDLEAKTKVSRKWASVKVVLKKEKIDRYKAHLAWTVNLLSLSNPIYTR